MLEQHTVFKNNISIPFRGLFVATAAVSSAAAAVLFLSYKVLDYKRNLESRIAEVEVATQNLQPELSRINAENLELIHKNLQKVKSDYRQDVAALKVLQDNIKRNFNSNIRFFKKTLNDIKPESRANSDSALTYLT